MRHILVDRARTQLSRKRGGGRGRADLDVDQLAAPEQSDDVLAVDEALTRLAAKDTRKAKLVELRYFAGMTTDEAAAVLEISPATADRDWTFARAWLHRALADPD
jgi:RNA polymerase sigma factor (TIGR02999 family)